MSKTVGKFINLSEEWELDYCLKKYNFRQTEENRSILKNIINQKIKPYFDLTSSQNVSWEQIDEYNRKVGF
ncbi:hypothetical protein [Neisseria sicca]|uniref:hypothetical protein n=1 Tax=Neisseria sicca TaxID=490 RepID=UPI0011AE8414|nr:hypothetical protein [Neisseria sicca]